MLRTPYLPVHTLLALGDQLEADTAQPDSETLERDRARVRRFLDGLFARPDVAEALYLASPSLSRGVDAWRDNPTGRKAERVERALLSYASRMATRATPFGLFAGWSHGEVGSTNKLQLGPAGAYRRHAALDSGYLNALAEDLAADPSTSAKLHFVPNPSLYEAGGRLRYVYARGTDLDLVAITPDRVLRRVLEYCEPGVIAGKLTEVVRETDDQIEFDEAEQYVATLIEQQVLVSELTRFVTEPDPLAALIEKLTTVAPPEVLDALKQTHALLQDLQSRPAGTGLGHFRSIAEALRPLPRPIDPSRLLRCDLKKPADAELSNEVLTTICHGVDLLARIGGAEHVDPLSGFKTAFMRRYGDREVPLCEALDAESGVGFADAAVGVSAAAGAEALLEGLRFPSLDNPSATPYGPRDALLARWLLEAAREGRRQLALGHDEIAQLERLTPRADLPTSFTAMTTVLASDPESVARGAYSVYLGGIAGPSGANLLGRFCSSDDCLTDRVRGYLRAEEDQQPQAVFAEIVHLPEPRLGNVVTRPVLRRYEIPYLGQSGAPPADHIPVSDLRVSVRAGQIKLRSASLDREVIPRLTAAHNFAGRGNVPLYRFLCSLQHQNITPWISFTFGALSDAPFLPRVTADRLIVSRARWTVAAAELELVRKCTGVERFTAMQSLRCRHGLPRWVAVADKDKLIAVDLANAVFVDIVASLAEGRTQLAFVELFVAPDDLLATGPEGLYTHELLLPMHYTVPAVPVREAPPKTEMSNPPLLRRFAPGSEWLFVKLYTGAAGIDTVLRSIVRPIVADALAAGVADEWFFVRYSDPGWHLRLRVHGRGDRLLGEVLPALIAHCETGIDEGLMWRVQVDTYEREVERYGGDHGMILAERVFYADSEAALDVVEQLDRDEMGDSRWLFAVVGADRLMADLGLDVSQRHAVVAAAKARFARRFKVDAPLSRRVGQRYRVERAAVERAMIDPTGPLAAFTKRSEALQPVRATLVATIDEELLQSWVASVVHMQINRILRWAINRQEFVIYDFLARYYTSSLARDR